MGSRFRLPAVLVLATGILGMGSHAQAQRAPGLPAPIVVQAAAERGRVEGRVTDQDGGALAGVSVLAMGNAVAAVRSDSRGWFRLSLPAGEYVLRAMRDGYVSTFREPVLVHSDLPIRRDIRLSRAGEDQAGSAARPLVTASGSDGVREAPASPEGADPAVVDDHSHSETAWRLRHLPRSVLRDEGGVGRMPEDATLALGASLVDWVVGTSARAAASFLTDTEFTGQLDFLTMTAVPASGWSGAEPQDMPRGVAYMVVGAPVGSHGDWSVRAAASPGAVSSWTLRTEYLTHADRVHAFRAGAAFSNQAYLGPQPALGGITQRQAGGVHAFDRWTLSRRLAVSYGGRVDRYDYLPGTPLVSGRLGFDVAVAPRIRFIALMASGAVAPGADQFLPPSRQGTWLPPERTFSSLDPLRPLSPERVTQYEAGGEVDLGHGAVVSVRRFREEVADQIVTLFGIDGPGQVGHYYVASAGAGTLGGWRIGVRGTISDVLAGSVTYARADVDWDAAPGSGRLMLARGPARTHTHDVTADLQATVPGVFTRVDLSVRLNNEFAGLRDRSLEASSAARFALNLSQQLPFKPWQRGEFNVVVSIRTLLRDIGSEGTFYDELLTVAPPTRLTSGVQMRF